MHYWHSLGYVHAASAVWCYERTTEQACGYRSSCMDLHYDCKNLKRNHTPLFGIAMNTTDFFWLKENPQIPWNKMPKNVSARAVREIYCDALRCLPHSFLSFPQGFQWVKVDGPSHHCNAHPQVIASKTLASALSQWPEICGVVGYGWLNLGPSINLIVDHCADFKPLKIARFFEGSRHCSLMFLTSSMGAIETCSDDCRAKSMIEDVRMMLGGVN